MGIFDKIKGAIFGHANAAPAPSAEPTASAPAPAPQGSAPSAAPSAPAPAPAGAPAAVDVAAILNAAVAKKGQKLNWKTSIVDLMKALDLDSSLAARKELAAELDYKGDTNDSAKMNVWLHKALMQKLAENGGKIPASLLD